MYENVSWLWNVLTLMENASLTKFNYKDIEVKFEITSSLITLTLITDALDLWFKSNIN
jgi:hypothetical protein